MIYNITVERYDQNSHIRMLEIYTLQARNIAHIDIYVVGYAKME